MYFCPHDWNRLAVPHVDEVIRSWKLEKMVGPLTLTLNPRTGFIDPGRKKVPRTVARIFKLLPLRKIS